MPPFFESLGFNLTNIDNRHIWGNDASQQDDHRFWNPELPPFCSTGSVLKAVELVAINTGGSGPTCDGSRF
jgi:hypothetical protein